MIGRAGEDVVTIERAARHLLPELRLVRYAGHDPVESDFDYVGEPVPNLGNQWSARYTGTLTPPESGRYLFSVNPAANAKIFIDGKLVAQGNTEAQKLVTAFVDRLLVRKDLAAIDTYVDTDYHEHNPDIPDAPPA